MSFDAYTTAGQGQNLFQQLCVQSVRDPVNGVDLNDPGGGPYQIGRRWFNKVNENYWRYQGQGIWILDSSNPGPLIKIGVPAGTSPIQPDAAGLVNFTSNAGTVTISGSAGGLGSQNINFDVNASTIVEKFTVQTGSPTIINPTAGNINVNGAVIAAGTNPVQSAGTSSNTYQIQVQQASTVSPTPLNNNAVGLASYNTNQFTIDSTSGMVSLKGGTVNPAIQTLTGDDAVAVSPSGTGTINLIGNTTANSTHAKPVYVVNSASNTERIDIQVAAQSGSSSINNAGLSSFNTQFSVDGNGYVSLATGVSQGTYTPTIINATTQGTVTYSFQQGFYFIIGNLCTVICNVNWTANTGSGEQRVTLPFTAVATSPLFCQNDGDNPNFADGSHHLVTFATTTSTNYLRVFADTSSTAITSQNANRGYVFQITYKIT